MRNYIPIPERKVCQVLKNAFLNSKSQKPWQVFWNGYCSFFPTKECHEIKVKPSNFTQFDETKLFTVIKDQYTLLTKKNKFRLDNDYKTSSA